MSRPICHFGILSWIPAQNQISTTRCFIANNRIEDILLTSETFHQ